MSDDWRKRARCLDEDPELFFLTAGTNTYAGQVQLAVAKAVCARCPSQPECLVWAVDALPYGVAGGLSEEERAVIRGRTRRAAARPQRPECGTPAGYQAHRRAGETCTSCRTAENRRTVDAARRARSQTAVGAR